MPETVEEGWYTDPYGRHESRWMSDGKPTKLVRDGTVESHDEPPDEPPKSPAHPIDGTQVPDGEDLRRADDDEQGPHLQAQGPTTALIRDMWEWPS